MVWETLPNIISFTAGADTIHCAAFLRTFFAFSRILALTVGPLSADRRRCHHGRVHQKPQGHKGGALGRRAVQPQRPVPLRVIRTGGRRRVDRRSGHRRGDFQDGGEREQREGRRRPAEARADNHRGALRGAAIRARDETQIQARITVSRKS